jgi:pimeloyl-ACP methyl ester carboxylesterase
MKMQAEVSGKGSPIVLVPGGLTGWLSWRPHVERLSRTRRVYLVQLLNVQLGLENTPLPADYSVRMESQALEATLADLGLCGEVDFVAWSFGGLVTLTYALDHPDRVRTLTLIEPPAVWALRAKGPFDEDTNRVVSYLKTPLDAVTEDDLEGFARVVGFLSASEEGKTIPQWPVWMKHRFSLRNNPFVVAHDDDGARLAAFAPRVLLVKGTASAPFLHKIIDVLAASFPHAEVTEMPAGHAPHIVSMERFLGELKAFQENGARL